MSQSSEHGTSSGGLNTGVNLSDSSDAVFFADYLSPITIFRYKFDKMLIAKGFVCVTDGLKWGFIPHDFAYAVKQKGFFAIETGFTCF